MYYLNILYCNVLSEDSCPASGTVQYRVLGKGGSHALLGSQ
jgi:hypothetical protein